MIGAGFFFFFGASQKDMPALDGDNIQTLEKRTALSYLANNGLNNVSVIYQEHKN